MLELMQLHTTNRKWCTAYRILPIRMTELPWWSFTYSKLTQTVDAHRSCRRVRTQNAWDSSFLTPTVVALRPQFPRKFAFKLTQSPLRTQQFWPISAHSASTVGAGEKSSIRTNRKLTTRFLTSHILCTLPLRPQRVAQNAILRFFR